MKEDEDASLIKCRRVTLEETKMIGEVRREAFNVLLTPKATYSLGKTWSFSN